MSTDQYAPSRETTEGRVFTVTGGDWDTVLGGSGDPIHDERIVVNLGPQHPSTHGVLRLILELEGETVTEARSVVGYLHTGIEKNLEYRNWTQGTTFVTRMDYLAPIFNETGYCLAVERLLGIEDQITERARVIRVMMMELNRIASHLVWLATTGMELGALSMMIYGFREREYILDIFEMVSGLRMNMAYVRPGGVAQDVPDRALKKIQEFLDFMPERLKSYEELLSGSPIWTRRTQGVAVLDVQGCLALGITGPVLRSAGLPWDLRKTMPYCDYETYDFDVITSKDADVWGRYQVRLGEMRESLKHHRAGDGPAKAGPGDDRGQEDRLACTAGRGPGRPRQLARTHCQDHGSVDGVADPSLQARHRGLPGPAGPGLRAAGVASRRTRSARRLRRWHPSVPGSLPGAELRQLAGHPRDGRGRPAGRRNRRGRLAGPRHGWV